MAATYPTTAGSPDPSVLGAPGRSRHLRMRPRTAWLRPTAVLVLASGLTVGSLSVIASFVSRWG